MARKNLRGLKRGNLKAALRDLKASTRYKQGKNKKAKRHEQATASGAPGEEPVKRHTKADRALTVLEKQAQALIPEGQRVLLVGEGNLSFAAALCRHLGKASGVYATCYDDEKTAAEKYSDLAANKAEVEEKHGGTALFGVDAAVLHEVHEFKGAFGRIVWNFPHIGGGEKSVEKSIASHRRLLGKFFVSAQQCLTSSPDAAIHVALKVGEPYKSWKLVQSVRAVCPELELKTAVPFVPSAWPGYAHRRTVGFEERFSKADSEELEKGAKVYVFGRRKER